MGGRKMNESLPGTQNSNSNPVNTSTIGEELTIDGNVTSRGEVRLHGQVQGDVHCVALVLGENAHLEGGTAQDVTIRGRLVGPIRALSVTLQPGSHVEGRIYHKRLSVEQGALFEGESHPVDDPLSSSLDGIPLEPPALSGHCEAKSKEPTKKFIRSLSDAPTP